MAKRKRPLNPLPQRPPEWMDEPELQAAFMGGLRDAGMQQAADTRRQRSEAEDKRRRKRGETEGKRRWELLRGERKEAQDWRQTLEKRRRLDKAAADKLAQDKWAYTQQAPQRQFEYAKRIAEMREQMKFDAEVKEIEEQTKGRVQYETFRKKMFEKGMRPKDINEALRMWRARHPDIEVEKEPKAPEPAKAPTTKTINGRVMGWNHQSGTFDIDFGPAGQAKKEVETPDVTEADFFRGAWQDAVEANKGKGVRIEDRQWPFKTDRYFNDADVTDEERMQFVKDEVAPLRAGIQRAYEMQTGQVQPAAAPTAPTAPTPQGPMGMSTQDIGTLPQQAAQAGQGRVDEQLDIVAEMKRIAKEGTPEQKLDASKWLKQKGFDK